MHMNIPYRKIIFTLTHLNLFLRYGIKRCFRVFKHQMSIGSCLYTCPVSWLASNGSNRDLEYCIIFAHFKRQIIPLVPNELIGTMINIRIENNCLKSYFSIVKLALKKDDSWKPLWHVWDLWACYLAHLCQRFPIFI
jgi:hypothetical protein